ncbi:unnamed protein product [Parascedosporium putredinis]|uniref:Mid2 domain-containing protein n=1 Tax=Parascedosporium putredinis TaxID=1442378 RepID=A0A9P1H5L2_9PEZI|nr:unnamed protein product [Parascedosporium putredinis]CAI7997881.1 unnamed protein product [Parascedosporium putredinis]
MRIKQRDAALAEADLPALFGRQSTDCTSGSNFYRCALNNFAGCCTVDPCALTSGCPDKGRRPRERYQHRKQRRRRRHPSTSTPPTNNDRTSAPPNSTPTANIPETTTKTTAIPVTTTDSSGQIVTTVIETTITEAAGPLETGAGGGTAAGSGSGSGGSGSGSDSGGKKLSTGAIAGIAVGALLLLALLALLFLLRRRRKNARGPAQADFPLPCTVASYRGSRNGDPRLSHASYVSSLASDTLPPGSPAPYARHTPPARRTPPPIAIRALPIRLRDGRLPAPFRGSEMDATPAPLRVSEMDAAPAPLRVSELPANGSPSHTRGPWHP